VEKEASDNKRLSMENEQLNWRIKQEATTNTSLTFRHHSQSASAIFFFIVCTSVVDP
jgi:hypothetical protein